MTISGAIAAVAIAAIDHHFTPCELTWAATMYGTVVASVRARTAAKKYSFQEKMTARMKAATSPGPATGKTIRRKAPTIDAPSTSAACSSSTGIELNGCA